MTIKSEYYTLILTSTYNLSGLLILQGSFNKEGEFFKKQNNFFPHKCKLCIFLKLVFSKNYFNLIKIFVLRLFKIAVNQTVLQP